MNLIEIKHTIKENLLITFLNFNNSIINLPLSNFLDSYLLESDLVVHIGAHIGQERFVYLRNNVEVYWVEAVPLYYRKLTRNLKHFRKQTAVLATAYSKTGVKKKFYVSNMGGQASSLLKIKRHSEIWQDIYLEKNFVTETITLDDLIKKRHIQLKSTNLLVLDTQGTELEVLKGTSINLKFFQYIVTEAADFESYQGCCTKKDLITYLKQFGFKLEYQSAPFASLPDQSGNYYEVIFRNTYK